MPKLSRANALGATSALVLTSPLLASLARAAATTTKADPGDLRLLDSSISFERAALKAYADAEATNVLTPTVLAVLKGFMADHQAHLDALVAVVAQSGATPSAETAAVPTATLTNEAEILVFAYAVERQGANTYLGTIAQYKNRDLATTAASMLGVDATHVALLAEALKRNPAYPSGFITA